MSFIIKINNENREISDETTEKAIKAYLGVPEKEKDYFDDFTLGAVFTTANRISFSERVIIEGESGQLAVITPTGMKMRAATTALRDRDEGYFKKYHYQKVGKLTDLLLRSRKQLATNYPARWLRTCGHVDWDSED